MGESVGPSMAPLKSMEDQQERWRHLDSSSVNAVSFGFVATAILISMFVVMAIFERFLRSPHQDTLLILLSPSPDLEPGKLHSHPNSPKMSVYAKCVSVLMPGHDIPTFIGHPAPVPCPPEQISWPSHQQIPTGCSTSDSSQQ